MKLNTIYNEDCFITMGRMIKQNKKVSAVITSPFYNTGRGSSRHTSQRTRDTYEGRYDVHLDNMTDDEYIDFTIRLFEKYDKIIKKNGVILYNISYGSENTHLMWLVIAEIIKKTNFVVADDIIWKKKSALPNNVSSNKLTRIVEHIFVFCRKSEFKTFDCNKAVSSISSRGQKFYENIFNFIEAPNNDGKNSLNKATYSSDLIKFLIETYIKDNGIVYDSFMGTGTTAIGCLKADRNIRYVGSEISKAQCEYANDRILKFTNELTKLNVDK